MKADNKLPLSFARAFGIIIPLCLAAVLFAGIIISTSNDIYAFVKPDKQITVTLEQSYDVKDLSELLQDNDVINNAFAFEVYLKSKGLDTNVPHLIGEFTLNSCMSYREIVDEFF